MYTPKSFVETRLDRLHRLIEDESFATLSSVSDNGEPEASHLPLLLDRTAGPQGTLVGHMARANGQWERAAGRQVLAIFHGPHAYVSPTWYEVTNSVPTWNYVVVHASGRLRPIADRARLRELLSRTVEVYESRLLRPWSLNVPESRFVDALLETIVGFEIPIERLEGTWKLGQNHDAARRQRVAERLRAQPGADAQAIAAWMLTT